MDSKDSQPKRLTRAETKARTRALLLDAAAREFARKGFAGASVDRIAESAGFSVGALYSNFAKKEDLFLELLASRSGSLLAEAAGIVVEEDSTLADRRQALGQLLVTAADKDGDLAPLQAEFWLYAMRRPEVQEHLSSQFRTTRDTLTEVLATRTRHPDIPLDDLSTVLLALFQGLVQLRRTDPALVPESLYGSALNWLLTGVNTLAGESS
ncbi:TetR/AcrR family transcriptional regulator [Streptacidiphilus sp. PAMC 29251]